MMRALALLALLAWCGSAGADPFSAVAALSTFAGAAAGTATFLGLSATAWLYVGVAASVLGAANSRRKQRKAASAARAQYNAGLQDRTVSALRSDPPWQFVYGRCIVGGAYVDIITTDKTTNRETGDTVTKPDAYKTLVLLLAAHEVEAIHEIYVDGVPVGAVDGDGWAAIGSSTTVNFSASTNIVAWADSPAVNGHAITFAGGTLPAELTAGAVYYVRERTAAGFKLASGPSGAAIDLTTDGSGTITGTLRSPFFSEVTDARIMEFTDELTFAEGTLVEVFSAFAYGGTENQTPVTVTIESGNRLVAPAPYAGIPLVVNFSFTRDYPVVRIEKNLGADDQATSAQLAALVPSRYTSNHRLRGNAYCVITLDLEDVRFQGGVPNITADVSGRIVYDPRTDDYAWSDNPALCARDFLTAAWGFEIDEADIDDDSVTAAANACDELIDLDVGGTVTEDQPRYTCNGSATTEAGREATLENIVDTMAGAAVYGAKWRLLAGSWSASVLSLGDDDLLGQVDVVQTDTPIVELFNGLRGQIMLQDAQSPSDFNPYQNSTFAADDGRDLWSDVSFPFVNNLARARNLCRIAVEANRAGQVIRFPATLKAWPVQVGDRVTVTSSEYGITSKLYRCTDWEFDVTGAVLLTLQEDAEEIYDLADAAVADPTPNADLVDPWAVPALQNVTATSGATTRQLQADGTVVPRVLVEWDEVENGGVTNGGSIEVLWRSQLSANWQLQRVDGEEVQAYLYGVTSGDVILVQARARNALGRLGPAVFVVHTVEGDNEGPEDVADFAYSIKPGQVALTWTPCVATDYSVTEIRVGASWAAGVFGWSGKASERNVARPANGTYTLWAKHVDNSGNYSTNAVSLTVTVDDSIDAGGGGTLVLTVDGPPVFFFADGTTHTTASPTLTFTARLIGLFGEADITAEAFDAADASLGAVTLGGSGNARTLTGAQFVAAGTSGSVRTVRVTATLSGATDLIDVIRYDPTVADPFIYLSNPQHSVGTDEAGEWGDYTGATTDVAVFDAGVEDTDNWSFAISPDSGVTATINGGAGPVTGTTAVTVAVSASLLDDGAVLITASKGGESDLTATFRIVKRPAQGVARLLYFTPRSDITLPVDATGNVTSFTNAWTYAKVRLQNGVDATDEYTFAKVDENVTSELTDNTVRITGWVGIGAFGSTISGTFSLTGTGWGRAAPVVIFGGGVWLQPGQDPTFVNPFSVVKRGLDHETWDNVSLGVTGQWSLGSWTGDAFVLASSGSSNQALYSADGGLTWSVATLPSTVSRLHVRAQAGTFLITQNGGTAGARSTDGGATWSAVTTPASPSNHWGVGANKWLFRDGASSHYISTDNGTSWSGVSPGMTVSSAIGFLGRIIAADQGASTVLKVSENDGASWASVPLPASCTNGKLLNINGVLYLYGSIKVQYSPDGLRWFWSGDTVANSFVWLVSAEEMDIDLVPLLDNSSGGWVKLPMLATHPTEGAVHVTASKPGEDDLTATLPVQLGAIVPPNVTSNIKPAFLQLPSTADGVVTDYSNAVFTVNAVLSSLTITSEYTWAWTTTNLTPSSGSGNTATITAMDDAEDTGTIQFTGTRAGYGTINLSATVVKSKGADDSGLRIGAAYRIGSVTNTHVAFRLTSAGLVQRKEGVSGTWITLGQWDSPASASSGAGAWTRIDLLSTPDGSSTVTGTTSGTFVALTSDREVSLADATTGLHTVDLVLYLADNSGGTDPLASLVTLMLDVP